MKGEHVYEPWYFFSISMKLFLVWYKHVLVLLSISNAYYSMKKRRKPHIRDDQRG